MEENELRTDYWVDNRSNRQFPLWVIFKQIGHDPDMCDGLPYVRQSRRDLPSLIKSLENHPLVPRLAEDLGIRVDELRAALWYVTWTLETRPAPESWHLWNQKVDDAWAHGILQPERQA